MKEVTSGEPQCLTNPHHRLELKQTIMRADGSLVLMFQCLACMRVYREDG